MTPRCEGHKTTALPNRSKFSFVPGADLSLKESSLEGYLHTSGLPGSAYLVQTSYGPIWEVSENSERRNARSSG